jgi:hypothetical protein
LEGGFEILLHLLEVVHNPSDEGFVDQLLEFVEAVGLLGGAKFVGLLEIAVFKLDGQASVRFENGDFENGVIEVTENSHRRGKKEPLAPGQYFSGGSEWLVI